MSTVKRKDLLPKIPKPKLEDVLPKYRHHKIPKDRHVCPQCSGVGRIVRSDQEPNSIEGHKLSIRVDCPKCNGKGHINVSYYEEVLKEKIAEWKKRETLRKEEQRKLKNAVSKLTDDEFKIIESFVRRVSDKWPSKYDL